MADFSVSTAAFAGFRFIKERPLTIIIWAVAYVVLMVVFFVIAFGLMGAAFFPMIANPQAVSDNPEQFLNSLPAFFGAGVMLIVLGILAAGVVYGAAYRAFLRPEQGGLGYLRFGADEMRLIGAYLLLVLLYVIATFVSAAVVGGVSVGAGDAGGGIGVLLNLVFVCVIIWGVVRLSLTLPATFAGRRIGLGESWRLTKGRFWKLLGAYLIAGVLLFVAYLAVVLLMVAVGGAAFAGLSAGQNPAQVLFGSVPLILIFGLLYPVVAACALAVMVGPTASIYSQLASDPDKTAETFA